MKLIKLNRDRFYFRGWSVLGVFNTIIGCLFNKVLAVSIDNETNKIVKWWFDKATNCPPAED